MLQGWAVPRGQNGQGTLTLGTGMEYIAMHGPLGRALESDWTKQCSDGRDPFPDDGAGRARHVAYEGERGLELMFMERSVCGKHCERHDEFNFAGEG